MEPENSRKPHSPLLLVVAVMFCALSALLFALLVYFGYECFSATRVCSPTRTVGLYLASLVAGVPAMALMAHIGRRRVALVFFFGWVSVAMTPPTLLAISEFLATLG